MKCAQIAGDDNISREFSWGDAVAREVRYHKTCYDKYCYDAER